MNNGEKGEGTEQPGGKPIEITPELVRQVAARVYALWRQELAIDQERRPSGGPLHRH